MSDLNFQKLQTKTGVPLYVMYLPHTQSVATGVLIKAGTRDEQWPQEAGIAHALEHMVFQGTKKFPTSLELTGSLESIGGYVDPWTWAEGTFFCARTPSQYTEKGIDVLSEIINNPLIPPEKIPVEMKNIMEEINMNIDDPMRFIDMLTSRFIYQNHPLAKEGLGTKESLASFKQEHFFNFKNRFYLPDNFVFLAIGNIQPAQAQTLFENYFPQQSTGTPNVRTETPLVPSKETRFVYKKKIDQANVVLSTTLGKSNERATKAIEMFSVMLSGGMSFPLFQEIRDKRGLAYAVSATVYRFSDIGQFYLYLGVDPRRYQEAIDASIDLMQKHKHDERLLARAKELLLGHLALRFEHTGTLLESAAFSILFDGYPKGYDDLVRDIEEITIDDVAHAVDQYLKPEQIRRILLVPETLNIA